MMLFQELDIWKAARSLAITFLLSLRQLRLISASKGSILCELQVEKQHLVCCNTLTKREKGEEV